MKPWIGAVAAAAAMFAVPATALAGPEDPALLKFKLDNSSQYDDFESLGFDMDHAVENGEGDAIIVSAWVDDEQLQDRSRARLRGRRRRPQQGELRPRSAPRASPTRWRRSTPRRRSRRTRPAEGRQRRCRVDPRAARRLLREQRRQVPLDRGQRRRRHVHRRQPERLQRPDRDGRVVRRGRQQARRGRAAAPTRTPTSRRTTTSTTTRSSGSGTRATPRPRSRRSRSRPTTATSTRSPPRNGSRKNPPPNSATFKSGFVTRYYDSPDAYAKVRALAAEFRTSPRSRICPRRRGATSVPPRRCSATRTRRPRSSRTRARTRRRRTSSSTTTTCRSRATRRPRPSAPSIVVVTSKVMGHLGGNSLDRPPRRRRPARPGAQRHLHGQRAAREPRLERRQARSRAPPTR